MDEGVYHFDNTTYDPDDIDDKLPLVPDEPIQRSILNQSNHITELRGELRETTLESYKKNLVKTLYDEIWKRYRIAPDKMDYNQFKVSDDGKTLFWVVGDKEIRITAKRGEATFLSLVSLANEYNKTVGSGGTLAVRQCLNLPDYNSKTRISQQARQAFESARNDLSTSMDNILLQDLSNTTELQSLTNTVGEVDTSVKSLETSFNNLDVHAQTQTEGLTLREIQGLDKALQSIRGELTNNLAKLTEIDKDIAKEKQKLEQAGDDEFQQQRITERIQNLEDERSARLEAASANKEALRSQVNRIKETINKVLKEDTTLGERIKTLFKEQGITIVSILTAFGMIIGVIVEAIIPSSGGGTTSKPTPPSDGSGAKDWIKKQLSNLGKLLANLAGKAANALPGIIGSIVSWLLSTTGKVINWFGNNLWALVVAVAGLLYVAAKEWINKSRK